MTYFVLPNAWNLAGSLLPWIPDRVRAWLDLAAAQSPFQNGEAPLESAHAISAVAWAQLGVAIALWCLLPVVVGTRRAVRTEVR